MHKPKSYYRYFMSNATAISNENKTFTDHKLVYNIKIDIYTIISLELLYKIQVTYNLLLCLPLKL